MPLIKRTIAIGGLGASQRRPLSPHRDGAPRIVALGLPMPACRHLLQDGRLRAARRCLYRVLWALSPAGSASASPMPCRRPGRSECRQALAQIDSNTTPCGLGTRPQSEIHDQAEGLQACDSFPPPQAALQLSQPSPAQPAPEPPCPPASQLDEQRSALAAWSESVLEVNAQLQGVLPRYVRDLHLQTPQHGPFDRDNLKWELGEERQQWALVAAVALHRVKDFLAGEGERGGCRVQLRVVNGQGAKRGVCSYARPTHKHEQVQQELTKMDDPQPSLPQGEPVPEGYTARRGTLQMKRSARVGCQYHFFVQTYSKVPGVAIFKFPCDKGDCVRSCFLMQHVKKGGAPAHAGLRKHVRYTDEILDWILARLKVHMKPALIMSGAPAALPFSLQVSASAADAPVRVLSAAGWFRRCAGLREIVRARAGISEDDSPEEVTLKLRSSAHARDFYVTGHFIRDLRQRKLDVEWRRADRDVDSVRAAVRLSCSFLSLTCCGRCACRVRWGSCPRQVCRPAKTRCFGATKGSFRDALRSVCSTRPTSRSQKRSRSG